MALEHLAPALMRLALAQETRATKRLLPHLSTMVLPVVVGLKVAADLRAAAEVVCVWRLQQRLNCQPRSFS